MITSPPRPPSPPERPPRGTNFSLRKATHPLPPSPALMRIFASSINTVASSQWPVASKTLLTTETRSRGEKQITQKNKNKNGNQNKKPRGLRGFQIHPPRATK